ncbi:MAG TPA: ATP-binding protein [Polyangiaceae bacterium]|nr:ATP-binding protein [Polyangiaceae bacterium]
MAQDAVQGSTDARAPRRASLVAALSALAAKVQRGRTVDAVLETAGEGILRLGMRLVAFQVADDDLLLRYVATAPSRLAAIERRVGRPLRGLSAPLADWKLVRTVVQGRRTTYKRDLDLFDRFLREATGFDPTPLDAAPATAGITTGVLAPLYVRDAPWGLLAVVSRALTQRDADAVALFALHVAAALEAAESIEALERANRELARAQQELVQRERLAALGELAAIVAHEVRNPLGVLFNSIASLRRALRGGWGDAASAHRVEDAQTLLSIAAEEAERLDHIVSDLLDFARPNQLRLEACSLRELLEDAMMACTARADVTICVDVSDDLPPVAIDPRFLRRAIINVVLNGLDAMARGGTLTVRGTIEQREAISFARIDVVDTGEGITAPARGRIFEPFFTTKPSGTGLGLAVVKRIVDAHRGEIDVHSTADGTTFTLRIPIHRE